MASAFVGNAVASVPPAETAGAQESRFREEAERLKKEQEQQKKQPTSPLIITEVDTQKVPSKGSAQFSVEQVPASGPAAAKPTIVIPQKSFITSDQKSAIKQKAVMYKNEAEAKIKSLYHRIKNKFSKNDVVSAKNPAATSAAKKTSAEGSQQFGVERAIFSGPGVPVPLPPVAPVRQPAVQQPIKTSPAAAVVSAPAVQPVQPAPVKISAPVVSQPIPAATPVQAVPAAVTAPVPAAVPTPAVSQPVPAAITTPAPAVTSAQPAVALPVVVPPALPATQLAPISPVTQLELLMQEASSKQDFERAIMLREKINELLRDPQIKNLYEMELRMREAARALDFEKAIQLRDQIRDLQQRVRVTVPLPPEVKVPVVKAPEVKFRIKNVAVTGNEQITADEIQPLTSTLLGREITLSDIRKTASDIKALYRSKGFVAAYVYIPPQAIDPDGEVQMRVVEGRLGAIKVEGNRWFSSEVITGMLERHSFEPGNIINYQNLRNGLLQINEHRDIQTRAILQPGAQAGTTDVLLQVQDKMPFHVSTDINNYGTRLTGKERYGTTITDTNLTGQLDELTLRYQGSNGTKGVATDYNRPLFPAWGTRAGFGYVHGDVDLGGDFKALDVKGEADNYSFYLTQPLAKNETWDTSLKFGFDHKSVTNKILDKTTGQDEIRMFDTVFDIEETDQYGKTFMPQGFHFAPAAFGASERNDESLTRAGSGGPLFIYRTQLERYQYLPHGFSLAFRGNMQMTGDKLPPSEQFQLGGMSNVRGYPQGEYVGDTGASAQMELTAPVPFIPENWKVPYSQDLLRDQIKLVGFYDMGMADLHGALPGEASSKDISGTGFGLRMRLYDKFTARLEYAFPLSEKTSDGSNGVLYYGMSMDLI